MIRGELVNLRAIEWSDLSIIPRWLNDPAVMRGWGFSAAARSTHDVAREVEDWLAQEAALGRPAALMADTLEGEPIGLVVLRVERPEARSLELSLLIGDPAHWGQGFGGDILRTALEACFDGWGAHRLGVRVEEGNERALALYRRFGFHAEGRLRQDGVPRWPARRRAALFAPRLRVAKRRLSGLLTGDPLAAQRLQHDTLAKASDERPRAVDHGPDALVGQRGIVVGFAAPDLVEPDAVRVVRRDVDGPKVATRRRGNELCAFEQDREEIVPLSGLRLHVADQTVASHQLLPLRTHLPIVSPYRSAPKMGVDAHAQAEHRD